MIDRNLSNHPGVCGLIPRYTNAPMTVQFGLPIVGHPNGGGEVEGNYTSNNSYPSPGYGEDSLGLELSAYASSPNSLYMYEQERTDMQNFYDGACGSNCPMGDDVKMDEYVNDLSSLNPAMETTSINTWTANTGLTATSERGDNVKTTWSGKEMGLLNIEEVFQVDSSDVIQGPTLAELNSSDSMNFFDDIGSSKGVSRNREVLCNQPAMMPVTIPSSCIISSDLKAVRKPLVSDPMNYSVSAKLSVMPKVVGSINAQTASKASHMDNVSLQQLLSSKARQSPHIMLRHQPTVSKSSRATYSSAVDDKSFGSLDEKWEEIKQFIHEEGTAGGSTCKRFKSESDADVEEVDLQEDDFEDMDDSDHSDEEEEMSTDIDSVASSNSPSQHFDNCELDSDKPFWLYNIQSKGPKGSRLCLYVEQPDPHVLSKFHDPVFDPGQRRVAGIINGGKQRRGDGNDVSPNPKRLHNIGQELRKLTKCINDMTPVCELPVNARQRSRREKNKLASRACRLKKKAQHEANKIKLFGLDSEHEKLNLVLSGIKGELKKRFQNPQETFEDKMTFKLDNLIKTHLTHMIAGHTTEYVNTVLDKYASGDVKKGLKY